MVGWKGALGEGSDLAFFLLLCLPSEVLCWSRVLPVFFFTVLLPDKYLLQVSGTFTLASDSDTITTCVTKAT